MLHYNKNISDKECYKLLTFFDSILVPPDRFRQEVLLNLKNIFGYERATFFLIDENGYMCDPITLNIENQACDIYCSYYFQKDIFAPKRILTQALEKKVVTVTDLMPLQKFEMTEYYNDFLKKQDIYHEIAIFLIDNYRLIGVIGLFRSVREKGFSNLEIDRLQKISSHVSKILSKNLFLEDTKHQKEILEAFSNRSPNGLIIFDKNFTVYFYNDAAKEICREFFPKTDCPKKFIKNILYKHPTWQEGLQQILLSRQKRYLIQIVPAVHQTFKFKELYMACLVPEASSPTAILPKEAAQNNLTNREKEILELLLKGMSNQQIAEALFVSVHTVKTHLQNIFKKMNVNNRVSLLYKLGFLHKDFII